LSSKKGKAEAEIYIYTITILNLHIVQTWIASIQKYSYIFYFGGWCIAKCG
jgi:hypothetical protein